MKKILVLVCMLCSFGIIKSKAQDSDFKPGELTPKVRILSMYWFAKNTEFNNIRFGVPVKIYFFGEKESYDYLRSGGVAAINGSTKIDAFYDNGKNTDRAFLYKCQFVLIERGQEYRALAIIKDYGPKDDCWVITQQETKAGKYPVVYARDSKGSFLMQNGKKVQNNIWTLGAIVNISQHPSFGFAGNEALISKNFKSVSGSLKSLLKKNN